MLIKTIQYSLISVFSFDSHRLHHSWNRQFKPFSDGLNCFYFPVRKQRHAPVYNSSFHNIFGFLLARPLLLLKYVSNPLTAQKTFEYICFLTVIVGYVRLEQH